MIPIPFERTTSFVSGTKNGPREIIAASSQVELYDEELGREIADVGIYTLPVMELRVGIGFCRWAYPASATGGPYCE